MLGIGKLKDQKMRKKISIFVCLFILAYGANAQKPDSNLISRPSTSQRLLRQELEKSINETRVLRQLTHFDNKSIQIAALLLFNYDKMIKLNKYDHIAYTNKVYIFN